MGDLSGGFGIDGRVQNNSSYVALNGLNTFTGNVSIVTGQINANTLANTGVASSLGKGTRISLGGGIRSTSQPRLYWVDRYSDRS